MKAFVLFTILFALVAGSVAVNTLSIADYDQNTGELKFTATDPNTDVTETITVDGVATTDIRLVKDTTTLQSTDATFTFKKSDPTAPTRIDAYDGLTVTDGVAAVIEDDVKLAADKLVLDSGSTIKVSGGTLEVSDTNGGDGIVSVQRDGTLDAKTSLVNVAVSVEGGKLDSTTNSAPHYQRPTVYEPKVATDRLSVEKRAQFDSFTAAVTALPSAELELKEAGTTFGDFNVDGKLNVQSPDATVVDKIALEKYSDATFTAGADVRTVEMKEGATISNVQVKESVLVERTATTTGTVDDTHVNSATFVGVDVYGSAYNKVTFDTKDLVSATDSPKIVCERPKFEAQTTDLRTNVESYDGVFGKADNLAALSIVGTEDASLELTGDTVFKKLATADERHVIDVKTTLAPRDVDDSVSLDGVLRFTKEFIIDARAKWAHLKESILSSDVVRATGGVKIAKSIEVAGVDSKLILGAPDAHTDVKSLVDVSAGKRFEQLNALRVTDGGELKVDGDTTVDKGVEIQLDADTTATIGASVDGDIRAKEGTTVAIDSNDGYVERLVAESTELDATISVTNDATKNTEGSTVHIGTIETKDSDLQLKTEVRFNTGSLSDGTTVTADYNIKLGAVNDGDATKVLTAEQEKGLVAGDNVRFVGDATADVPRELQVEQDGRLTLGTTATFQDIVTNVDAKSTLSVQRDTQIDGVNSNLRLAGELLVRADDEGKTSVEDAKTVINMPVETRDGATIVGDAADLRKKIVEVTDELKIAGSLTTSNVDVKPLGAVIVADNGKLSVGEASRFDATKIDVQRKATLETKSDGAINVQTLQVDDTAALSFGVDTKVNADEVLTKGDVGTQSRFGLINLKKLTVSSLSADKAFTVKSRLRFAANSVLARDTTQAGAELRLDGTEAKFDGAAELRDLVLRSDGSKITTDSTVSLRDAYLKLRSSTTPTTSFREPANTRIACDKCTFTRAVDATRKKLDADRTIFAVEGKTTVEGIESVTFDGAIKADAPLDFTKSTADTTETKVTASIDTVSIERLDDTKTEERNADVPTLSTTQDVNLEIKSLTVDDADLKRSLQLDGATTIDSFDVQRGDVLVKTSDEMRFIDVSDDVVREIKQLTTADGTKLTTTTNVVLGEATIAGDLNIERDLTFSGDKPSLSATADNSQIVLGSVERDVTIKIDETKPVLFDVTKEVLVRTAVDGVNRKTGVTVDGAWKTDVKVDDGRFTLTSGSVEKLTVSGFRSSLSLAPRDGQTVTVKRIEDVSGGTVRIDTRRGDVTVDGAFVLKKDSRTYLDATRLRAMQVKELEAAGDLAVNVRAEDLAAADEFKVISVDGVVRGEFDTAVAVVDAKGRKRADSKVVTVETRADGVYVVQRDAAEYVKSVSSASSLAYATLAAVAAVLAFVAL